MRNIKNLTLIVNQLDKQNREKKFSENKQKIQHEFEQFKAQRVYRIYFINNNFQNPD